MKMLINSKDTGSSEMWNSVYISVKGISDDGKMYKHSWDKDKLITNFDEIIAQVLSVTGVTIRDKELESLYEKIISKKENEDLTSFYAEAFKLLNEKESGISEIDKTIFYDTKNKIALDFMRDVVGEKIDPSRVEYNYIYGENNEPPTVYWDHLRIFIDDGERFTVLPPVMIDKDVLLYYDFCDHERDKICFYDQQEEAEIRSRNEEEEQNWANYNYIGQYNDIEGAYFWSQKEYDFENKEDINPKAFRYYLPTRSQLNEFIHKNYFSGIWQDMLPVEALDEKSKIILGLQEAPSHPAVDLQDVANVASTVRLPGFENTMREMVKAQTQEKEALDQEGPTQE